VSQPEPARQTLATVMSSTGDHTAKRGVSGVTEAHGVSESQVGLKPVNQAVLGACRRTLARIGHIGPSSLAITSASSHENRERVACGLATTASSELGLRTILVDLDPHHTGPYQGNPDRSDTRILDLFQGDRSIEDYLTLAGRKLEIAAVPQFPPAGASPIPIEWSIDAIERLQERCDLLVAILPALDAGAAAAHLSRLFTRVVLVVSTGSVSHQILESTVSDLPERPLVIFDATSKPRGIRRILHRQ
jgi:Mrp family chromosome partitioning ATPase